MELTEHHRLATLAEMRSFRWGLLALVSGIVLAGFWWWLTHAEASGLIEIKFGLIHIKIILVAGFLVALVAVVLDSLLKRYARNSGVPVEEDRLSPARKTLLLVVVLGALYFGVMQAQRVSTRDRLDEIARRLLAKCQDGNTPPIPASEAVAMLRREREEERRARGETRSR
jgi:hypothetical protein